MLHATKGEFPDALRRNVVGQLNQLLADVLDLWMQSRQAQWNVKGPSFITLHELFGRVAETLDAFANEVAERIAALGGIAQGTAQAVAKESRLPKFPTELVTGRGHLEALSGSMACLARLAREARGGAVDLGDASTAELFTEIGLGVDKMLWLLEAHLQAEE